MIGESEVTFTDYGLTVECALFTYLLYRTDGRLPIKVWVMLFFASISIGALTGGTVHGFFPDKATTGYAVLWTITLLAIGVTALALWAIGANIQFSAATARWITFAAAVEFTAYCVIVLFFTQEFYVVIVNYLPAVSFLMIVFGLVYMRTREARVLVGLGGLALILVASWVQYERIALHPVYFNHNVFYHLIQAVALFLIFWNSRWFVVTETTK